MVRLTNQNNGRPEEAYRLAVLEVDGRMFANEDKPWFRVFKAAMLELDPQELPERIAAANEAVQVRLKEIQGDTDHYAERQQIEDALSSLRTLEREK